MALEVDAVRIRNKISTLSVLHTILGIVCVVYGIPMSLAPRYFFEVYGHPYKLTEFECYLARCHGVMLFTVATFNFSRAASPAYQWILGSLAPLVGVVGLGVAECYAHFVARGLVKGSEPAKTTHFFIGPVLFGTLTLLGLFNFFYNTLPIAKYSQTESYTTSEKIEESSKEEKVVEEPIGKAKAKKAE